VFFFCFWLCVVGDCYWGVTFYSLFFLVDIKV
jgi:hypothetical protein